MNRRGLAWWFLLLALVAIVAIGFYLGATHQEARPASDSAPAAEGSG
jgi:hypothetical protein